MKVTVVRCTDWQLVADMAARTQGLKPRPITAKFLKKALISQHSMLRVMMFDIRVQGLPYYCHVSFVRHHVWVQPFVRTSRPDSMNPVPFDRRAARQDAPADMTLFLNLQALINIMQKRLCSNADEETMFIALLIRQEFLNDPDPFMQLVGQALRPSCVWNGGHCPEVFKPCGQFPVLAESLFFARQQ